MITSARLEVLGGAKKGSNWKRDSQERLSPPLALPCRLGSLLPELSVSVGGCDAPQGLPSAPAAAAQAMDNSRQVKDKRVSFQFILSESIAPRDGTRNNNGSSGTRQSARVYQKLLDHPFTSLGGLLDECPNEYDLKQSISCLN